jgi:hypothetical protein
MKTSKEMADSVFQIRDALNEKKKKRKIIAKKAVYIVSAACMLGGIFLGIRYSSSARKRTPDISVIDTTENINETEYTSQTSGKEEQIVTDSTQSTSINKTGTTESKIYTSSAEKTIPTTETNTENNTDNADENNVTDSDDTEKPHEIRTETATHESIATTVSVSKEPETTVSFSINAPSTPGAVNTENDGMITATPAGEETNVDSFPGSAKHDDRPVEMEYTEAVFHDKKYKFTGKEADAGIIEDYIDEAEMKGNDGETELKCKAKAYKLKDYDENTAIAIKFEGSEKYYFFVFSTENN